MPALDGSVESARVTSYRGDSPTTRLILQENREEVFFKGIAPIAHNHQIHVEGKYQSIIDILVEIDPRSAAAILKGDLPPVEGQGFHARTIDDCTAHVSYVECQ
jgi:hypothetical protein